MPDRLSILCVHGIGHGDRDPLLVPSWTSAIEQDLHRWNPDLEVEFEFLRYDSLFDHMPLNAATYAEAFARLLTSGVFHGIDDLFRGTRGLLDIPEQIRGTAGMIAQWASENDLRDALRTLVREKLNAQSYDVVCAHSLGSLVCYDTFRRNPGLFTGKLFLTLGSQIGNPFVRDCFAGRIEPLDVRSWYHLYNPEDHVFTAEIRLQASNFVEIRTDFDKPNDILNHDPIWYFNHVNTQARVWRDVSDSRPARVMERDFKITRRLTARPQRRALLIGINAYPNPANRLEGCVNDIYLMSSVLQECGFRPEEIRIIVDERATTEHILERFHWLLDDVQGGDERVLFYSGHGAQIPTYDVHGEVDHLDECLVPYDFDWSPEHAIRDKQFVEFYSQLPYDSRFVAVFDCCHSGGMSRDGGSRVRGIDPPDDIRHRNLKWNSKIGMWEDRDLRSPTRSIHGSKSRRESYLGSKGVTYRFGRGIGLRGLPSKTYKPERKGLRHKGPYLPVIFEACQEEELSYEYRHGAASYGAFTFSLAKVLHEDRAMGKNPTFHTLLRLTGKRLEDLQYEQTPCLVGPKQVLTRPIPWFRPRTRRQANAM
ncbi:MAG: caspase family protein [Nitrospirota bacterium]|nr:caspase family protein [Nitrospirota bacterium]